MLNYQHLIVYAYVYRFSNKFIISTRPSVASKSPIENMYGFMHFCFNLFYLFQFPNASIFVCKDSKSRSLSIFVSIVTKKYYKKEVMFTFHT